jgi:hypothetical protein
MKLGVSLIVFGLVACGGKEPPPATPPSNVVAVPDAGPPDAAPLTGIALVVATFSGFRDDMCKCVDKACADEVQDRMTKWSMKMAKEASSESSQKPDEATMKLMTEVGQQYGECMTKAMTTTP